MSPICVNVAETLIPESRHLAKPGVICYRSTVAESKDFYPYQQK